MSDSGFVCGVHEAEVRLRGGLTFVGDLVPLTAVRWQRIRDDVSTASVTIPTTQCCDLLDELRTIIHELHIIRNGVTVWQGPITRIEYEWDKVQIFAEDVMWVAKRTILNEGYDQSYPAVGNVLTRMDWLIRNKCFALNGDPWKVLPHLHPMRHSPGEPSTTRKVNAWQMYVWEDIDKYAEDYGADYCVVNRDVYYFDTHLAWAVLPPLDEQYLSQFPRIVEYGNQMASRAVVTDGAGHAGISGGSAPDYGVVDLLISNAPEEGAAAAGGAAPSAGEIAQWTATAARNLQGRNPAPLAIVIPENTTLMPGAPWQMDDLIPGAWFEASITLMCRTVTEWHRLHEIVVSETALDGETVQFTSVSAPADRVDP